MLGSPHFMPACTEKLKELFSSALFVLLNRLSASTTNTEVKTDLKMLTVQLISYLPAQGLIHFQIDF